MKRRTMILAFTLTLGMSGLAYGTWRGMDFLVQRYAKEGSLWDAGTWPGMLGLSPEQAARVSDLEGRMRRELEPAENDLAKGQIAMCRVMMASGETDRAGLSGALDQVAKSQRRREEVMAEHLIGLRAILSPEQHKALMTALMKDVCKACRHSTGGHTDHCGLCALP